jgi:hypothetical protein
MQEQNNEVVVALRGGPEGLPERVELPGAPAGTIKIPFRNGYEHFAPAADATTPVFDWTMRTLVAE